MKFRPCIDLHRGKVKQIVGASLTDTGARENFVSQRSAAWYASLYRERDLPGGHVIMLGPGNEEQALSALRAYPGGLQIGGGITPKNALGFLDAGASHVIVTSYVFRNGGLDERRLSEMVDRVGHTRLVLDLSCRRVGDQYLIATDRWQQISDLPLNAATLKRLAPYCDEFLVHAADVEGRQGGIEEPVVSILGEHKAVPTVYAGGIGSLDDIELLARLGNNRVDFTVGSALDLFGGALSFEELAAGYRNA